MDRIIISNLEMTQDRRDKVTWPYTRLCLCPQRRQVFWFQSTLLREALAHLQLIFCHEQRKSSGATVEHVRLTALTITWSAGGPLVKDGPPCH